MVNTHMEEEITEEWKTKKYYSKYNISNLGRVKHIARNEIIKGSIDGDGYIQVSLYPDNNEIGLEKKPLRLHRLVAELFCSNDSPEKKNIVNHLNSDKLDNRSINLEWTTNLENTRHAAKNGLLLATNHRAVQRICPKTREIKVYESITKAFEDNRDVLKYDNYIICVCNGTQKTAGGYIWKYVEENIIEEKPDGKEVEGFENYIITDTGRIYSKKSKRFLNPSLNGSGYHIIDLYATECDEKKEIKEYTRKRHERRQKFRVHFLVAKHFIENDDPETKHEINHKDKNRINNNVSNLEWISSIENLQHAHNKKVIQCDKDDNLIKIYESSLLASKDNNINPKTLSSAIKRKTFTGGFYWKFES
jgi:hypothetical protein